ncbi:hypothetical protein FPJ27_36635 (plasmid) [Burkholderia sp. MS455]|uniref:hypothetical protein n=1 Tax=Burkholderia sp. MS455 TaxID=2811788 RepID=UPI00195BAC5C|nr:hypothetical protein [Burkholderia sp. MS455]QRR07629.1 hypothetical protein FPJ27_15285 [Burkholderia sp. MS455]QRR11745.1 hypothetical protein FPJ27_36635 [Burkholderia sp. MS455]
MNNANQDLFVFTDTNETPRVPGRRARINLERLGAAFPGANRTPVSSGLQLNLDDEVTVYLSTVRIRPGPQSGSWAWHGQLAGNPAIYGHLAVTGLDGGEGEMAISGSVHVEERAYVFESTGTGAEVSIAAMGLLEPAACELVHALGAPLTAPHTPSARLAERAAAGEGTAPAAIHLLAVYGTALAERYPGGLAALTAKVAHWVEVGNTTLANSGVRAVLSFDMAEANLLTEQKVRRLLRNEIGKTEGSGHPYQPSGAAALQVSALRDQFKADLVVGLAEQAESDGASGVILGVSNMVARTPRDDRSTLPYAVCTVALTNPIKRVPVPDYALIHELGHLMGLQHDAASTEGRDVDQDAQFDYARGYIPHDRSFVTTMGYDRAGVGPHIPYFSTPERQWKGVAVGAPIGSADEADAVTLLQVTTAAVSRYRSHRDGAARYAVESKVVPELGGYVIVEPGGLHEPGARVRVRVVPRGGFTFQRVLVNGQVLETADSEVTITDNTTIVAEFDVGANEFPVTTEVKSADGQPNQATLTITPWQPRYLSGTDIEVDLSVASDEVAFTGWEIDGHAEWNALNAGEKAKLFLRVEQSHHIVGKVAKRDCLVDISGSPATLGTVSLIPDKTMPDDFMPFFHYGVPAGRILTFRADAYEDAPFERWQIDAGTIVREYQSGDSSFVDVRIERSGSVMACFSSGEPLVEVSTTIQPPRPHGPAMVNVTPTKPQDAAPGYWYPRGTAVTLGLYWWDEHASTQYSVTWQVEEGGTVRTYHQESVPLVVNSTTQVDVTLTPKAGAVE